MSGLKSLFLAILALALVCGAARAEKRLALVIGNGDYKGEGALPLPNAVRDADSMVEALRAAGFNVFRNGLHDLKLGEVNQVLLDFARQAKDADTVLVYYAGHAISLDGSSILVPTDIDVSNIIENDTEAYADLYISQSTIPLRNVLQAMGDATQKIVIIDACRDDPINEAKLNGKLLPNTSRIFHEKTSPQPGTVLIYSTGEDQRSHDSIQVVDANGPFVTAFLKYYKIPGSNLFDIITHVNNDMKDRLILAQSKSKNPQSDQSAQIIGLPRGSQFYFFAPMENKPDDRAVREQINQLASMLEKLKQIYELPEPAPPAATPAVTPAGSNPAAAPPGESEFCTPNGSETIRRARRCARQALEKGLTAESIGDSAAAKALFAEVRGWFAKAAASGDAVDKNYYGNMLLLGLGGPIDVDLGKRELTEAAQAGQTSAQFELGKIAYDDKDLTTARGWFSKVLVDCSQIGTPYMEEKILSAYYLGLIFFAQDHDLPHARFCMYRAAVRHNREAQSWLDDHRL